MSAATATKTQAPADGLIEVVLTLRPGQYAEVGHDLQALREKLNLPRSASNTEVILEALHRQAVAD